MSPQQWVEATQAHLEAQANPAQAAPMARYMKGHFPFLGLPKPQRQQLTKPLLSALKGQSEVDEPWLHHAATALWALPQREFQYVALDLLWQQRKALTPASLPLAETLLAQKSWWDSVDGLSSDLVGPLVQRYPQLKPRMDRLAQHPNFWLRRCALIHQLAYKDQTDPKRLFAYCLDNAADPEFFIRKAIGWCLRQYAYTDPQAVYNFVDNYRSHFSALTLREALKHRQ